MTSDPYLYPGTSVLRNHRGLRDHEKLSKFERRETASAINDLRKNPVNGDFDYAHLREIHRRIFDKVYPFAGELRTVNLEKSEAVLDGASVRYAPFHTVAQDAASQLQTINGRDWTGLQDMSDPKQMETFAKDISELWRIHPFREGNTRTTMAFMSQFAHEHDFTLTPELFDKHSDFTRKALVVATFDQPEHLARIFTDSRNLMIGKETDLASRISGWDGTKDPELRGAASMLALVDAELRRAGVDDQDRMAVRHNAAHSLARGMLHGKTYDVATLSSRSAERTLIDHDTKPRGRER